jgi:hypothetical protein
MINESILEQKKNHLLQFKNLNTESIEKFIKSINLQLQVNLSEFQI